MIFSKYLFPYKLGFQNFVSGYLLGVIYKDGGLFGTEVAFGLKKSWGGGGPGVLNISLFLVKWGVIGHVSGGVVVHGNKI